MHHFPLKTEHLNGFLMFSGGREGVHWEQIYYSKSGICHGSVKPFFTGLAEAELVSIAKVIKTMWIKL